MKDQAPTYKIWGVDNVVYGPVELPILVNWVKASRIVADNWIYLEHENKWQLASEVECLQMFFRSDAHPARRPTDRTGPRPDIKPSSLRRVKIFANMPEGHLEAFLDYMEVADVDQFAVIVRQGSPGDAMYILMDGEVRVRLIIDDKETTLATLEPGNFFGEISLFDHGPRSADVVANLDSKLLKISAGAFQRLVREKPDLAAPFLYGMGKTLTARIRADNKRFSDAIHLSHHASR